MKRPTEAIAFHDNPDVVRELLRIATLQPGLQQLSCYLDLVRPLVPAAIRNNAAEGSETRYPQGFLAALSVAAGLTSYSEGGGTTGLPFTFPELQAFVVQATDADGIFNPLVLFETMGGVLPTSEEE